MYYVKQLLVVAYTFIQQKNIHKFSLTRKKKKGLPDLELDPQEAKLNPK